MVDASRRSAPSLPTIHSERSPGAASAPIGAGYRRREPEKTVLHAVVRDHLETFLEEARERDGEGYPAFMLALISDPTVLRRILQHLGLPVDGPPAAPAAHRCDERLLFDESGASRTTSARSPP